MTETVGSTLQEFLQAQTKIVDAALERWIPGVNVVPGIIHESMRYSIFAGGKRVRPILAIAAAAAVRDLAPGVEDAAATLEMIHTYSLIHDDLPAMDNDDLRRGRPTNHKVFGDGMAILAGDSLLTLAFEVLARLPQATPEVRVRLVEELARASGTVGGMIGGQVLDIEGEKKAATTELLDAIHHAKTGALLRCSVRMGGIYAGASQAQLAALSSFGEHVGLAFQIVDDILDIEQPSEALGKTAGKDQAQQKITFPAVYGLDRSRVMAEEQRAEAHLALEIFGQRAQRLHEIADFIVDRKA